MNSGDRSFRFVLAPETLVMLSLNVDYQELCDHHWRLVLTIN